MKEEILKEYEPKIKGIKNYVVDDISKCQGTIEAVCPYCNHVFKNSWCEVDLSEDGADIVECCNCFKHFVVSATTETRYYSHTLEYEITEWYNAIEEAVACYDRENSEEWEKKMIKRYKDRLLHIVELFEKHKSQFELEYKEVNE